MYKSRKWKKRLVWIPIKAWRWISQKSNNYEEYDDLASGVFILYYYYYIS
jgi:hypothetical protein